MDKYLILINELKQKITDLENEKKQVLRDRENNDKDADIAYDETDILGEEIDKLKTQEGKIIDFPEKLERKKLIHLAMAFGMATICALILLFTTFFAKAVTFNDLIYLATIALGSSGFSIVSYFLAKNELKKEISGLTLEDLEEEINDKEKQKTTKNKEYSLLCEKVRNSYEQEETLENELEIARNELERMTTIRNRIIETILENPVVENLFNEETAKQEEKNPVMVKGI